MENSIALPESFYCADNMTHVSLFFTMFNTSLAYWLIPLTVLLLMCGHEVFATQKAVVKNEGSVLLGRWSSWMPRFIHNAIYAFKASGLLINGHTRFKQKPFQLVRNNGNIVVLPHSHLEQLSTLPEDIASPHGALEHDLLGPHTGLNLILESRLHHTVVQRKLTARLPTLAPKLEEELVTAMDEYFPIFEANESAWKSFQPYQVLAKVSARLAARALVGPELCRNETWLDISVNYTENLFRTIVILRLFPTWTHSVLRYFLPSYWSGQRYVRNAKKVLGPIIQDLLDKNDRGQWSPDNNNEESNVLCWLVDMAKGRDRDAGTLAHVEVLLALASVHTTLLRMVNVLYDVTANPEYVPELRAEIQQTLEDQNGKWTHASYARLQKLDSVLRESQRMSPPTILGLKRLFKKSYVFDDGTRIPKGTYATLPIYAIENDPEITPNPSLFDGLRSYRLRVQGKIQAQKSTSKNGVKGDEHLLFSSFEPHVLNFGYGKTACPGRFFASLVIKIVMVKLLSDYDFKFNEGEGRPPNLLAHEFLFCWPWQWMNVRKTKSVGSL